MDLPARAVDAARRRTWSSTAPSTCPLWHPISISGYHIREAGSTAAQELAFTLADGFAYVEAAIERGLDVDAFAPRLSFFFNAHLDFFEEIGKYRAARRIWAREMKERYGAKNELSLRMRFHTQTAGVSLTAQQPEVNLIRTTVEALAAVLGGTQSLHTNSFDEALALPTEHAVKLALRTQQVLAHEVGVTSTADPLGGSYYVEWMTDKMEREAYAYFDRIREFGGVIPAIDAGFFQREIADAAFDYQEQVDAGDRVVVGVNAYVDENEAPPEILKVDSALEGQAARAARRGARPPRRRRGRAQPRRARAGRARGPQPDAVARRLRPRLRERRRDVRRAARRVRPLPRDALLLGLTRAPERAPSGTWHRRCSRHRSRTRRGHHGREPVMPKNLLARTAPALAAVAVVVAVAVAAAPRAATAAPAHHSAASADGFGFHGRAPGAATSEEAPMPVTMPTRRACALVTTDCARVLPIAAAADPQPMTLTFPRQPSRARGRP